MDKEKEVKGKEVKTVTGKEKAGKDQLDTMLRGVEKFKELSQGEMIMKRVGGSPKEEEIRFGYTAAGWPMQGPDVAEVEAGIDRVYSFIARNMLFVFNDQTEFLEEILTYTRELDESYNPTDKIQEKSKFHLMDSLRYIMSTFQPERVTYRTEARMKLHDKKNQRNPARRRRMAVSR